MLDNIIHFQKPYIINSFSIILFYMIATITQAQAATPGTHAPQQLDIRPHEAADTCKADIAQVRVTVNNVGYGGILSVELYHDPKNFLNKKGRTRRIRIPATDTSHTVCFTLEKQGTYAVAAYHDRDGNRKLNKRWNLLPKEPFGLSNNPKLAYSFPKFSDSAFTTTDLGIDITINLQEP